MPNIVYLHGFGSGPDSTKGRFFQRNFSMIGAEVHQPDLAEGDFQGLTITGQLAVVDRAVREREPVLLAGSSLGGYLAALYAARHPERVPSLVLLAPAFGFARRWAEQLGEAESLGGYLAALYAARHPERVPRVSAWFTTTAPKTASRSATSYTKTPSNTKISRM